MRNGRLGRAIAVYTLVIASALPSVACEARGVKCAAPTAKFPIYGTVVDKDDSVRGCYMLHVKRYDNLEIETVRVNLFRFKGAELHQNVTYAQPPVD